MEDDDDIDETKRAYAEKKAELRRREGETARLEEEKYRLRMKIGNYMAQRSISTFEIDDRTFLRAYFGGDGKLGRLYTHTDMDEAEARQLLQTFVTLRRRRLERGWKNDESEHEEYRSMRKLMYHMWRKNVKTMRVDDETIVRREDGCDGPERLHLLRA